MTRLRRHSLAAPAMTHRLPVAGGHLHRHEGVVPAQVAGQRLWRHCRRAVSASLLTAAAASTECSIRIRAIRTAVPKTAGMKCVTCCPRVSRPRKTSPATKEEP